MKKTKTMVIILCVGILFLAYLLIGNPIVAYHNHALKKSVTSLNADETVTLDAVVPFSWDKVYTFEPYTSKEKMAEIIGFESGSLRETASEGMVQLLFVKGQRVTASVCGYPDALGYQIAFDSPLSYGEGIQFTVDTEEGIVVLRQLES